MIDAARPYPLAWPTGKPRTPAAKRAAAAFGEVRIGPLTGARRQPITITVAIERLLLELELLDVAEVIVSTNIPPGRDGLPSGARITVDDPGVAVYFRTQKGEPHCLSVDRWDRVADNIAAIAAHVKAVRGMLRWGVADLRTAFSGFRMIDAGPPWWRVLGFDGPTADPGVIRSRFHELARRHHPDAGGSTAKMAELSAAYETGLAAAEEARAHVHR